MTSCTGVIYISFVLVLWMQRQCPVLREILSKKACGLSLFVVIQELWSLFCNWLLAILSE